MERRNGEKDEPLSRAELVLGAWAIGAVIAALILATYLLDPPITVARMGEVAGAVGLVLLVFGLVSMVRLPVWADAVGGLENLYTLHRGFGLAAYACMLLHPLLLAQQGGWTTLSPEGKDLPFRLGWSGLLIMMLGLLCTFVLKSGGYALWRRLHALLLIAFACIVVHVAAYQNEWPWPGRVLFFLLLGVGLLALVLRYWGVDRGAGATGYRVDAVDHPSAEVIDLRLTPLAAPLPLRSGQFVFARFAPSGDYAGCGHFHPFTARRVMPDGSLRLSIRAGGACTRLMLGIGSGARADLQGPYDRLFEHLRQEGQVWLAGGIGIEPFYQRLGSFEPVSGRVRLLYFFDRPEDAAHLVEIDAFAARRQGFSFHPVAIQGQGEAVEATLDALLPPWNDQQYVLCGPPGFSEFVSAYLAAHGVPRAAIRRLALADGAAA